MNSFHFKIWQAIIIRIFEIGGIGFQQNSSIGFYCNEYGTIFFERIIKVSRVWFGVDYSQSLSCQLSSCQKKPCTADIWRSYWHQKETRRTKDWLITYFMIRFYHILPWSKDVFKWANDVLSKVYECLERCKKERGVLLFKRVWVLTVNSLWSMEHKSEIS